jgi:ribitol 2-dehydrogenase
MTGPEDPFEGRAALVTGASSGIGRAYAEALSARGVSVCLVGRSPERLHAVADALPGPSVVVAGDVADPPTSAAAVAATLEAFDALDVVVANAGLYLGGEVDAADLSTIQQLVAVNVFGVIALVHAALPHLRAQGSGDILITSSVSGQQDIHWEPVYSASKHATEAFTHTLRRQLVGTGVRVGEISPGVVLNELWGFSAAETEDRLASGTGIRSSDVADAAMFMLAQPRHVTIRDLVILPSAQEI